MGPDLLSLLLDEMLRLCPDRRVELTQLELRFRQQWGGSHVYVGRRPTRVQHLIHDEVAVRRRRV